MGMADAEETPDTLARKWFVIAFFGALVFFSIVFYFVLAADVGPSEHTPVMVPHD
jgi:phage shock protein PspC (stress-responsive transcriptional regulator)